MNGQIVLCKGYNDGDELRRSLTDLLRYAPLMQSVSVVPVGLTNYRDKLEKLELLGPEDCAEAIDIIEETQRLAMEKCGIHFVQASDEFYLTAGRPLPEPSRYDGYPQLENGVGMLTLLHEEISEALKNVDPSADAETVSTFSGLLAAPSLQRELKRIGEKLPAKNILFYPLENHFFGEKITVTGLLTGRDILDGLRGKALGDRLLLPQCVFRSGEEVLLDDMTRSDLERELGVRCVIIGMGGDDLVDAINDRDYRYMGGGSAYELATEKFHKG